MRSRLTGALAAVALLGSALLAGCAGDTEITPPEPTDTSSRASTAQRVASGLAAALEERDLGAAQALATAAARPLLAAAVRNATELDLRVRRVAYVEEAALSAAELSGRPAGTWGATVELVWRLPGWDERDSRVETAVLLDGKGKVVGFAPGSDRVPLWLTGELEVRRTPRVLVLSAADAPALAVPRVLALGRQAVAEVSEALGWRGRLVLEVPRTEAELEQALQAEPGRYASIAAVTTPVDGSGGPAAPVHVFVNPTVFARLGELGAQVVMTHETVHVATRATASPAPHWLREGFADYVALSRADVPVAKAGAQALAKVRKDGPPEALPTDAALQSSAPGLGAAYEEAWLVCRHIAGRYGEARLVALYRAVDGGARLPAALRDVLGTSEQQLTSDWSRELARLAG